VIIIRCVFIYNSRSGRGKIKRKKEVILEHLRQVYDTVDVLETSSAQDTTDKARFACGKYDAIIFAGGDGTFNNIVNGISDMEIRPVLGCIPAGTVNDISRNFKISSNVYKALEVIKQGKINYFDIGKINDKYFVYVAAIGAFTKISYTTSQELKRRLGRIGYYLNAIKEFFVPVMIHVKMEIDEGYKEFKIPLMLVVNSSYIGGFKVNWENKIDDGYFDVIMVKKGIINGLFNLLGKSTKTVYRTKHLIVDVSNTVDWCTDGELGTCGRVEITNLQKHLRIFSL
jgi:diacylglycerol kinase (ATP)